jgi:hypothetical protein
MDDLAIIPVRRLRSRLPQLVDANAGSVNVCIWHDAEASLSRDDVR